MKRFAPKASWPRINLALLFLLTASPLGAPLLAQNATRECLCIDRDGRAIENCTCIRTPGAGDFRFFTTGNRARIGVTLEEATEGARINEVREGSPAAAAGLIQGDVITRVGGQSLREALPDRARERRVPEDGDVAVERLMVLAQEWEAGEAVELEYLRAGERRTVRVTPEETPADQLMPGIRVFGGDGARGLVFGPDGRFDVRMDSVMRGFRFDMDDLRVRAPLIARADSLGRATVLRFSDGCFGGGGRGLLAGGADCVDGVHMMALNPELGAYFGATRGVLVSSVEDDSPMGLRPGDVILSIGGRAVESPDQARRILASYEPSEEVPLRVRRRGEEIDVTARRR